MDKLKAALRTSEFWVGIVAAVLAFLVQQGLISQQVSDFVNGAVVYVVGRLISKLVKAAPPAPPSPPAGS